jgi:hypothetical protein
MEGDLGFISCVTRSRTNWVPIWTLRTFPASVHNDELWEHFMILVIRWVTACPALMHLKRHGSMQVLFPFFTFPSLQFSSFTINENWEGLYVKPLNYVQPSQFRGSRTSCGVPGMGFCSCANAWLVLSAGWIFCCLNEYRKCFAEVFFSHISW